jgi:hypothetical protein
MKGTYMTKLNLTYFKPGADGYTAKSMSFEPKLNAERSTANDDALASIVLDRTMSLNEKYNSIRENIANINPTLSADNKFTI